MVREARAVKRFARLGNGLGLSHRIVIVTTAFTVVAFTITALLMAAIVARAARDKLDDSLAQHMRSLVQIAAISSQGGLPVEANIERYARSEALLYANFRRNDVHASTTDAASANPVETIAPRWFASLTDLQDRVGHEAVIVNGSAVGEISAGLGAASVVDAAWLAWRSRVMLLAASFAVLLASVWLALRSNLKPLDMLARASVALGRGDFSRRVEVTGGRELRISLEAFNQMAESLERLVGALHRSEGLYETLVKAAPVGIFRTDTEGRMFYANDVLLQMAGVAADDMSARRWSAAYHPDDRDRVDGAWAEAMSARLPAEALTYRYVRQDGSETWGHGRAVPLFDAHGRFDGYVGVVTDITTERLLHMRAERMTSFYATLAQVNSAVIHSATEQELYDSICEVLVGKGGFAEAIVMLPDWPRQKYVLVTDVCAKERPADPVTELDIDSAAVETLSARCLCTGDSLTSNDILHDPRIGERYVGMLTGIGVRSVSTVAFRCFDNIVSVLTLLSAERDFFDEGIRELIEFVGRDVSHALENFEHERRRRDAEAMVVRSESLYSTLVEKAPMGVMQLDRDGKVVVVNDAMRALVGADKQDDFLRLWLSRVHPEDRATAERYQRDMQTDTRKVQASYRLVRDDGGEIVVHTQGLPISGKDGARDGYIIVVIDVTAETQARAKAERHSRLYATLSRVNSLIVQMRDERALLEQICTAIADAGRFERVILTQADWARGKAFEAYSAGALTEVPPELRERDLGDLDARNLTDDALVSGTMGVSNDYVNDPRIAPSMKAMALQLRFASIAAVPIRRDGRVAAVLSVVSSEKGFFTDDVQSLVEQIARDISFALDNLDQAHRKKLAEDAVLCSERRLNVTLRSIGDAVLVTDAQGCVTLMNPVAEALTGWREAEAIGRAAVEIFHIVNEQTRERVESPVERVLREGVTVGLANHTVLIAKNGEERPIADSGAPIRFEGDGTVNGAVLVFRDQSEEYRIQKALRDSERRYALLVKTLPIGVFQVDRDGVVAYGNEGIFKIAGLSGAGAPVDEWMAAIHPDDREHVGELWRHGVASGEAYSVNYRYLRPDGQINWVTTSIAPVLDEEGLLQGFIGGTVDITAERRNLELADRLQRLYVTLSRVNAIMVRAANRDQLFDEVCRSIVDDGRFEQASISLVDWDRRMVRQVCACGTLATPTTHRERSLDDAERRSISNIALESGTVAVVDDFLADERISEAYRRIARGVGTHSSCAVPLWLSGGIVGTLVIVSSEAGLFTREMVRLVEEIGRDVSFALDNLVRAEQKRAADEALARSEQNLNVTLRSIGDAVLVTDAGGRITLLNPVAEALTGWCEAEAIGRSAAEVFRIVNQETRAVVESPVDRVLREGVIVGLANHTVLIARDGSETPIADSGAPIRYERDGAVNGVVLVFRDQGEEYRMQKALRESEKLYSSLAKNVPVGIYLADVEGELRFANEQFLAILGIDAENLSAASAAALIHPDEVDRMARVWYRACKSGTPTDFGAYRYVRGDGSVIWARGIAAPVLDEDGRVALVAGVVEDITEKQHREIEIERLSRFNATMSQINAAIVRHSDLESLFEAVTRIAVDTGRFDLANLSAEDAQSGNFVPMSTAVGTRFSAHGKEPANMFAARGLSPVARKVVATGAAVVFNNVRDDLDIERYWRNQARAYGVASASAIPLTRFGAVIAVLSLLSSEPNFFSADILAMLEEIGRNLSHAVENIEKERQRQVAERALARNEERLRVGLSANNIGFFELDLKTGMIRVDAVCARLVGLGDADEELVATDMLTRLRLSDEAIADFDRFCAGIETGDLPYFVSEYPRTMPDGAVCWIRSQGAVSRERDEAGQPLRLLGVVSDVTERRALEERDRLAAAVFDNSREAIMIADAERNIVMVNQAFTRNAGYRPDEILGQCIEMLRSDRHDADFYAELAQVVEKQGSWQGEIWRKRKDGAVYPTLAAVSVVKDRDGRLTNIVIQEIDISAQKEFEQRIRHLAYRDALTGLPNRTLLRDRAEQGIALAHREGGTLALLFLDLDNFKNINDSLGHAMGDRLLKGIAQRLMHAVRETDTVGRLGGDEFLVMLPDADADAAAHVAQKLLEECSRSLQFESHSLAVTPSIGISLYPKDGADFDELLKMADTAMYRAKDEGRNGFRFYTPEMNQAVFRRMVMESNLRRAIDTQEFVLHYQPKFELRDQTLVGMEALIRWHQPQMGMVSPAQFIPIAEESGLIEAVGKWVLDAACRQARAWREAGLPLVRIAVNFSARQFAARNVAELVAQALEDAGIGGDSLEMEITESLLAQDMDYTLQVLRAVKRMGVHIAVDDFGTGYSSLSYLKRFPIDRLKIDQSFVRDIAHDLDDRAIAAAIVTMGHSLGMRVIAEGVENERQIEILRGMGCDEVQGFHLGRPVTADDMAALLGKSAQQSQSRATRKSV